jgi:hypothetical protein
MENRAHAPFPEADITATGDAIIRNRLNLIAIDPSRKTEDILTALENNRSRLKTLKSEYIKLVKIDDGIENSPSKKRQMVFHEIMRTCGAIESIKDELTQRGANFDIDGLDDEHPNAAFRRITAPAVKPDSSRIVFYYVVFSAVVFILWLFTANDWGHLGDFWQNHITSLWPGR